MNLHCVCFLILILVIITTYLIYEITKKKTIISGGSQSRINNSRRRSPKKNIVIDGLNYIMTETTPSDDWRKNMFIDYADPVQMKAALNRLSNKPGEKIFVFKNQDGYEVLPEEEKLYKYWADKYRINLLMAYDPKRPKSNKHFLRGRDDKLVLDTAAKYNAQIISKDKYRDKKYFKKIPPFKIKSYNYTP